VRCAVLLIVIWPLPQHFSGGVFEPWGFTVWIYVAFAWGIIGGIVIVVLPIIDFCKKGEGEVAAEKAAVEDATPAQASVQTASA
jgi:hypothetical protein